jgi:hypothetical protein
MPATTRAGQPAGTPIPDSRDRPYLPPRLVEEGVQVYQQADGVYPRSREQIERFFSRLELVPPYPGAEPAITHIGLWGAEAPELADSDGSHWWFGGVARRP